MTAGGSQRLGPNCYKVEWGEGVRRVEGYSSTSALSDGAADQDDQVFKSGDKV